MNQFFEIFCYVVGAHTCKNIMGSFCVKDLTPIFKLDIGDEITDDFNTHKIYSTTGILRDDIEGQNIVVPNIGVYFFKDIISDFHNYSQHEKVKHIHTYSVYDSAITDINGQYRVFLEPGNYTIKVEGGCYNSFFYNQEIITGLNNLYDTKVSNFTIKSKYEDITEINNSTKKIISGTALNSYNQPLENVEIIISQGNNVISYCKSDQRGKYQFIIDNGIYDVRIRSRNYTIKKINNFNFIDGQGFMTTLKENYAWFTKEEWIKFI